METLKDGRWMPPLPASWKFLSFRHVTSPPEGGRVTAMLERRESARGCDASRAKPRGQSTTVHRRPRPSVQLPSIPTLAINSSTHRVVGSSSLARAWDRGGKGGGNAGGRF